MVIHVKKITFILKMHKPSVILLDSMINRFLRGKQKDVQKRLEGLVKTL